MNKGTYIFWSIFIAAAAFRLATSFYTKSPDIGLCVGSKIEAVGLIKSDPERKESGQVFVVGFEKLCGTDIDVKVKTKLYPRYSFGETVSVSGKLSKPYNFSSDDGRSFDYKGYLQKDDIYFEIKSAEVHATTSRELGFAGGVKKFLFSLKHGFVSNLEKVLGDPHAALAAGLVVGEKSSLGTDLLNDFRIVGLIHIVVLSGFNITIVGVALRRLLSWLPRVWGIVFGAIGIMLFGVLVGGGATVVRSCFMGGVALVADLIRRDYSVVRALGFAAAIMLIQNPFILFHDPSFQLSFLATLGLILLASPLETKLGFITEKFGMRGTVASSLATQIFVSPYILYMMGQISLIGVVVNILVLPFIPATMLAVFVTGALGFVYHPLSVIAGYVSHLLLSYELFMVQNFARVPYAALYVPPFSFWWVIGFYVCFTGGFIWWQRRSLLQQKTNSS